MEDLRGRVGVTRSSSRSFKDYYTQFEGRRATGADFFRVLREHTAADISGI